MFDTRSEGMAAEVHVVDTAADLEDRRHQTWAQTLLRRGVCSGVIEAGDDVVAVASALLGSAGHGCGQKAQAAVATVPAEEAVAHFCPYGLPSMEYNCSKCPSHDRP